VTTDAATVTALTSALAAYKSRDGAVVTSSAQMSSNRPTATKNAPAPERPRDLAETVAYAASTGAPLWLRSYDGPAGDTDQAVSVAVGPDGSKVIVTGYSTGDAGYDYATVAYQA